MSDYYDGDFDNRRLLSNIRSIETKVERLDAHRELDAEYKKVITDKLLQTWRRTEICLYLNVIAVGLLAYIAFFK